MQDLSSRGIDWLADENNDVGNRTHNNTRNDVRYSGFEKRVSVREE